MPGRKAKPANVITMEGNALRKSKAEIEGRTKREEAMNVVQPDKFVAPDDMQGKERDVFYETKNMLKKMSLLHNADVRLVASYARTAVMVDELWAEIDTMGLTYVDEKGVVRNNPTINEWRRTTQQLVKLGNEIGFTPSSRASLANKQFGSEKKEDTKSEWD